MPRLALDRRKALDLEILQSTKSDSELASEYRVNRSLVFRRRAQLKNSTPIAALATSRAVAETVNKTQQQVQNALSDIVAQRKELLSVARARLLPLQRKMKSWFDDPARQKLQSSPLDPFEDQALAAYCGLVDRLLSGLQASTVSAENLARELKAAGDDTFSWENFIELVWPEICHECRLKLEGKFAPEREA